MRRLPAAPPIHEDAAIAATHARRVRMHSHSTLYSPSAAPPNVRFTANPGAAFPLRPPLKRHWPHGSFFRPTDSFSLTIQNA
jgi:hypothetical protein